MSDRVIHKYPADSDTVKMPTGAKVIHVEGQGTGLKIWAEVDPHEQLADWQFTLLTTGANVPDGFQHAATFLSGHFVFHAYLRPPSST